MKISIEIPIRGDSPLSHTWVNGDKIIVAFSLGNGYEPRLHTRKKILRTERKPFLS